MSSTVVATFTNATKADLAVIALERAGMLPESISVIETDTDDSSGETSGFYKEANPFFKGVTREVRRGNVEDASDHTKQAPLYTIIGCIGGCIMGALLMASVFAIPAYRQIIDAEPLVAFIGGSSIGGILGGSIAALSSSSRSYTELRYFKQVDKEHYVVAVECTRDQASGIVKILTAQNGTNIRFIPRATMGTTEAARDSALDNSATTAR